ncbi:MAG: aldehyde dehydrogenase family protein, partial [Spirochaetia bacterium]
MIHWILNWVKAHSLLVIGVTVFSVVLLLFSVFMIPILVLNLPKDYFISDKKRVRPAFLHPSLYAVYAALKNILGVILVFLGLLMLVLPGQGIITLLIGLMIMDLPGERRAARAAQKLWQATSIKERGRIIDRMRRYMNLNVERFAEVIGACTGKTRIDALSTEVIPALLAARYYAKNARRFLRPERIKHGPLLLFYKHSTLYREPYGVVGIISPWNYPFGIPFHEVISGLLAGNAVILKVATQVQPVGELFSDMCRAAGLPEGLFWHCMLPGSKVGPALLDAGIGKLFFTGSTEVGRLLARQAGERLIPVNLELGGNNPALVLKDANLTRAAAGAVWAGMSNCGQSCGRAQRLYVVEEVYEHFKAVLCKKVSSLTQGYAA